MKKSETFRSSQLSSGERKCCIEYAKMMLAGVGCLPSMVGQHELAFHYRRSLDPEEISMLPEGWCEIPAVDEGGNGKVLEVDV